MSKQETFTEKAKRIHNNFYSYDKSIYTKAKIKIIITCPIHGNFHQMPDNHLSGRGCSSCRLNKLKLLFTKSIDVFKIQANLKHNNKYDYSKVNYVNDSTKITIICPLHGEFIQLPNKHLNGRECNLCKPQKTANTFKTKYSKIFIEKAIKLHNNKYTYNINDYQAMKKIMKIICKIHGIFYQKPDNHLNGRGCPSCYNSTGENAIENFLTSNNIIYIKEKKFNNCANILPLPFDFYLPPHNTLIEFDGIQHFKPIAYFGGEDNFKKQQINDKIKNEYCFQNNIRLIRIPYHKIKEIKTILAIFI